MGKRIFHQASSRLLCKCFYPSYGFEAHGSFAFQNVKILPSHISVSFVTKGAGKWVLDPRDLVSELLQIRLVGQEISQLSMDSFEVEEFP